MSYARVSKALVLTLSLYAGFAGAANSAGQSSTLTVETAAKLAPTLWLAREAGALAGKAPAKAVEVLTNLLRQDWNAVVTCGEAQFLAPSDPRCLIGLRQLARTFYDGSIEKLDPALSEVVHFDISEDEAPRVSAQEATVRIHLPYGAARSTYVDFVAGIFPSRAVRKRLKLMAEYHSALQIWEDMDAAKIEFDPNVGIVDRWRTVRHLTDLANENDRLFVRPGEALYVTSKFIPLFERHLQAQEGIKATASMRELREFLIEAKRETPTLIAMQTYVDTVRVRIRDVGTRLKTATGLAYDCSNKGTLTLASCLRTLKRLDHYAARKGNFRPSGKLILIAGRGELEEEFDVFQAPEEKEPFEIFAVREGFDFGRLNNYVRDFGWLRK